MKRFLTVVAILFISSKAFATITDDIIQNAKDTLFKSATTATFYSLRNNEWQAGVVSPIVKFKTIADKVPFPLHVEYGYSHSMTNVNSRGTALVGGSLHFDEIPQVTKLLQTILPQKDWGYLSYLSAGVYSGYNFDRIDRDVAGNIIYGDGIEYGLYTGFDIKFGN